MDISFTSPFFVKHDCVAGVVTVYQRNPDGPAEIGRYARSYHSFGSSTFEPFRIGDTWYALYSGDYTCTRIMKLPECEDIGGETPDVYGFCPVEIYVPRFRIITTPNARFSVWPWEEREDAEQRDLELDAGPRVIHGLKDEDEVTDWEWANFGFVAGCVWGDDTFWKLQHLDLSRVEEGILKRDDRYGYLQIPSDLSLPEAVDMRFWEPEDGGVPRLGIAAVRVFDLNEGGAKEL